MTRRRQATLYLPTRIGARVDALRLRFNRAQHDLIRAHVTLCREDEVVDWSAIDARLRQIGRIDVTLRFGMPHRDGNLVFLPAEGSTAAFDDLRHSLLCAEGGIARPHVPHITLIHPRNGRCSDATFEELRRRCDPFVTTFRTVTLIEQIDGGRWEALATLP